MDLKGKVAVITGSSRGIGAATALKLAEAGAEIVVNYTSSEEKASAVVEKITGLGGKAAAFQADVSEFSAAEELMAGARAQFGTIDILVNNAGITRDNLLLRMKEEEWDRVIKVNLKGVYNCTRAVLRTMLKQKSGRIINLTSVIGLTGNAGQANYAAAKAGIIGLTKSTAREVAARGITVNAVAPGYIQTDMTEDLPEKVKEQLLAAVPLSRLGEPGDVAGLICFLASKEAAYITGQVINVDGGMVM